MNKVFLTGRLTRDPEMRSLASGKNVTTFTVASNEYLGGGSEKAEYSNVVTWDRLAEIAGTYLGKGQQVAVEGRLQTRSWDDDRGQHCCQVSPSLFRNRRSQCEPRLPSWPAPAQAAQAPASPKGSVPGPLSR